MVGSYAASLQMVYTFSGVSAHAAGDPFNGRSALDAAELMNVGVQFLREHMEPKCSVHYAFLDAGCVSPNVVQNKAKLVYMIRGENVIKAKALLSRVEKIAEGAALMTGCSVESYQVDGTSSSLSNQILEQLLQDNLCTVPLPAYTPAEKDFAEKLKATFAPSPLPGALTDSIPGLKKYIMEKTANGEKPINDFVIPYHPANPFSPGSTDVGDVSWLTPTAQFSAVTWPSGAPGHSWQNVACGTTGMAHKGMLYAAKVLCGAAADLMTQPDLLAQAKEEFAITANDGYHCPIGPDVVAKPC
jgi:aminobenzoyl-glutamate utilization protein B